MRIRRIFRVIFILALTVWKFISSHPSASASSSSRPSAPAPNSIQTAEAEHIEKVNCGNAKCFATFSGGAMQNIGYIVTQEKRRYTNVTSKLEKAWNVASHIKDIYNVSSLLLGPPETIFKDAQFLKTLNEKRQYPYVSYKDQTFSSEIPLVVQKSLVIPEPNMWWHYIVSEKQGKLGKSSLYLNFLLDHVDDLRSFGHNLYDDLVACQRMLKLYPCLSVDYQFIIDAEGRVHHLDVDRCFDNESLDINEVKRHGVWVKKFLNALIEKYMNAVNDAMEIRENAVIESVNILEKSTIQKP